LIEFAEESRKLIR